MPELADDPNNDAFTDNGVPRAFIRAYREAYIWANVSEADGMERPEDAEIDGYLPDRIADELREDARRFWKDHAELLEEATGDPDNGYDHAQAGHDLALTRNGHGTGYWDRDPRQLPKRLAEPLAEAARALPEQWIQIDGPDPATDWHLG